MSHLDKWQEFQEELSKLIEEQGTSPVQREIYDLFKEFESLKQEVKLLVDNFSKVREEEIAEVARSESPVETALELGLEDPIFVNTLRIQELSEKIASKGAGLDEKRAPIAQKALELSQKFEKMLKEAGEWIEFEAPRLGGLKSVGVFKTGSLEWLKERQKGIGGSCVFPLIYANGDELREFLSGKFKNLTEEDVQDGGGFDTAIGRGNAFEEYVRHTFAKNHPEFSVAHCKTSWVGIDNPLVRCNFDGLILDSSGKPTALLEIKTGKRSRWSESEFKKGVFRNGIELPLIVKPPITNPSRIEDVKTDSSDFRKYYYDIPAEYIYQTMWYATNAGISEAYIACILDDEDYREYKINVEALSDIMGWEKIEKKAFDNYKSYSDLERDENNVPIIKTRVLSQGLPSKVSDSFKKVLEGLSGISYKEIKERLGGKQVVYDLANLTEEYSPTFIGIDIETSGFSPSNSYILQLALGKYDSSSGEVSSIANKFYDIPEEAKARGYGAVDVHGIDESKVGGLPTFLDSKEGFLKILEVMFNNVLVAHNFAFEERFLARMLPGYLYLKEAGFIKKLDTRAVCRFFVKSPNNKLESFTTYTGGEYVDAHDALKDTMMMLEALARVKGNLRKYLQ